MIYAITDTHLGHENIKVLSAVRSFVFNRKPKTT